MESDASVFEALNASSLAVFVRESAWAYPILETLHILGLALVMGGILILDLRLIGFNRDIAMSALSRHVLPWVLGGIVANAVTGALLFVSDAEEFAANASFRVKLVLIALALANAVAFHILFKRGAAGWDRLAMPPMGARVLAATSVLLWIGVITAGRMMAYLK